MDTQIIIQTLHKQGDKKSLIAKQLGCHHNTVNTILECKTVSDNQREKPSVFHPYKPMIKELLDKNVNKVHTPEILTEPPMAQYNFSCVSQYSTCILYLYIGGILFHTGGLLYQLDVFLKHK